MTPGPLPTALAIMALSARVAFASPQADSALVIEPPRAEIGVLYSGVHLTVATELETGVEVALLVSGARADLHLRKQARVWRAFWAPSGEVTFSRVPALYLLRTSAALSDLAPPSVLDELGLGYESLTVGAGGKAAGVADQLFPELIHLKESEGLFRLATGEVRTELAGPGRQRVTMAVDLPAKAPPGSYRVEVFCFRDRRLSSRREGTFTLTRGAFNGFFSSLADRHGLLYGILAVVLAIGAGLLVGLAFGSVKAH